MLSDTDWEQVKLYAEAVEDEFESFNQHLRQQALVIPLSKLELLIRTMPPGYWRNELRSVYRERQTYDY